MNNLRLLAGLLCATLLSARVSALEPRIITLEEVFTIAEANSAQLRPGLSAIYEAESDISVARANRLPDINASISLSYIGDGFTTKRNFSDYQVAPIPHLGTGMNVGINQPVYAGGAITTGIQLAELKSSTARFSHDLHVDNLRFQLAGFYLDIYKYSNLKSVVESNITAAQKILDEMRVRHQQGTVLLNDITRYELLLSNLELSLIKIDNLLEILNNNLVITSGMPEGTVILPDSTILSRALPLTNEGWWQHEAELNSPSLALARNGVALSRKSEELVKSERLPKIGLQAGWTLDGPILVEIPPINRNLSYWYVGVGVTYNLSSLYKTNKSLARARISTRKAIEQLDATNENTQMAVRADYIKYLEAYEELKSRSKSVELAERNYLTTSTRYAEGMALITDMLDAANSQLEAQQQLVNSRIDIIYYYYKLLFTTGKI